MAKTKLILDTNIVSKIMSKSSQAEYVKELNGLLATHSFLVSIYTQYELLKGSDRDNQKLILDFLSKNYSRIELNEVTMNFSARIHNLYKSESSTKHMKITDGDIVNAAITIGMNCEVITTDNNDYPRPFFSEVSRHQIVYTGTKGRPVMDVAYRLKPDMTYLKHCASQFKI